MKNADVPLWDKGDKTDDYVKGGGSSGFPMFGGERGTDKSPVIEEIYQLVLGRKPSARELSYYRFSPSIRKPDVIKKLLNTDEHKELIKKGQDYPELEKQEKLSESTILKLKHSIEDQNGEIEQMKAILQEKNVEIASLREEKASPFISSTFVEPKGNIYYDKPSMNEKKEIGYEKKEKNLIDWLANFIKKISE